MSDAPSDRCGGCLRRKPQAPERSGHCVAERGAEVVRTPSAKADQRSVCAGPASPVAVPMLQLMGNAPLLDPATVGLVGFEQEAVSARRFRCIVNGQGPHQQSGSCRHGRNIQVVHVPSLPRLVGADALRVVAQIGHSLCMASAERAAESVVLWDFDGTLAHRDGLWGGCVIETLDAVVTDHGISRDQLRPLLRDGFPWHRHDVGHPELCEPDAWWSHVLDVLVRAVDGAGGSPAAVDAVRAGFRDRYLDASGWTVFDDTFPALQRTAESGWRNVVVSNHVPELAGIVAAVGLGDLIDGIVTSAVVGYEKPHPRIYRYALEAAGSPKRVWMIGDNPYADVIGAEQAGIPAILVRASSEKKWRATLRRNWPAAAPSAQRLVRRVVAGLDEAVSLLR